MKLSTVQPAPANRRTNNFRSAAPLDGGPAPAAGDGKPPSALFWLLLHALCCLASLAVGFRLSRLLFLLLFSSNSSSNPIHPHVRLSSPPSPLLLPLLSPPPPPAHLLPRPNTTAAAVAARRVVAGRHGIRVRPWPHPDPAEVVRAHRILASVQREQRRRYGPVPRPRPVVVVTPTYSRTFQALHLTGLAHSLSLVPFPLTWLVVEAGGPTNDTAALLAKARLPVLHLPFPEPMPSRWSDRHRTEARMRLYALRVIRERRLDGIVVFADDSNVHSLELFDEAQKVKWMGAVSLGILTHSGSSAMAAQTQQSEDGKESENPLLPVQGPACNSSGHLAGWHIFNALPYLEKSATVVGEGATVLPGKLEWAGFVLNSRLVWKEAEGKPDWVRDLDEVGMNGEEVESALVLLKDASFVEPLGSCGKKVLLWWLRVEARYDSKFPSGWIIDPPLEVTVPAKRTPWPEALPELPTVKMPVPQDRVGKRRSKTGKSSKSRRGSRGKRKREPHLDSHASEASQRQTK